MKAKLVIGRAGAGKTSFCLDEITQNIKSGFDKPLLLLVPNQFSLEMEKKLVQKTGGKGMDIAQVLSFERFSYRVFSLYGKPDKKNLDEIGKSALLRKILHENRESLKYYGGAYSKEGFINRLGALFSELHKYGINYETLAKTGDSSGLANTPLALKISDLSFILKEFSDYIKDEYITLEQNLDLLAEALPDAGYFHGSKIWIDGFFRFTEQDYSVIKKLCEICGEMTVSLTMPESTALDSKTGPYDPFFETKEATRRILSIFAESGITKPDIVRLKPKEARGYSEALLWLEREYFHFTPLPYTEKCESVHITAAANIYDEAETAVSEIAALVREKGLRYKEIAVCACALEEYEHVLRDAFQKYEMPYFIDMSRTVYSKRLVEAIRSLIETGVTNWGAESVIRLLRTGLLDFSDTETDILENYILEYGIKGYKWIYEWKSGAKNQRYDLPSLNTLRQRVLDTCAPFLSGFKNKNKPTVRQASVALFDFIEKNGVSERLVSSEENQRETAQIWNIVVSVFDKLVEILADEKVDIKTFSQIIEGALEGVTEGIIPQTADAVIIGDIKRTRLPEIKALFVLGLNDGIIPSPGSADGILSEADRIILAENGAVMAPSGTRQALCEQFLIYCALTKPKERLYLSWPAAGFDGEVLRKSIIIEKIETIFPKACGLSHESGETGINRVFYSKKAFVSEIAVHAGSIKKGELIDGAWADGLKWLHKTKYMSLITDGALATRRVTTLSEKSVNSFLRKDIYSSITRIEKYIKCPFSYFAEYGLNVRERTIYGLKPLDLGNIYHYTLDNISRQMEEKGLKWGSLGDGAADGIIESSVGEACADMDVFETSGKNKYLVSRLKRIAKRAVWALDYHVKCGSFTPFEYETGFGTEEGLLPPVVIELKEGYRFIFSGRIDRVDIYDKDGNRYVKIIDYKSGAQRFDLNEAYYGLQLQLILYLDAYLKSAGNTLPAGIFYFRVTDPVIDFPQEAGDEDAVIEGILNQLKLSGLAVNDLDIINSLHNDLSGASNIIPVKLKKPAKKGGEPEPDAYSSVATMEQFYMLMNRAADVVKDAGNRLIAGDIEPRPVKGVGKSPCVYCGYGAICGFDISAGYRHKSLKKLGRSEIFELLEEKSE